MQQNSNTFSEYENYNSIKFLFGILCFGGLSFMSEGYEGCISDRPIVEDCGLKWELKWFYLVAYKGQWCPMAVHNQLSGKHNIFFL